jgi:hypothetical protein
MGFCADSDQFFGAVVESDDRRFIDYDLVVVIDNRVGGAKVDSYFFCQRE